MTLKSARWIAALAFFALVLFGSGAFLHTVKPQLPAAGSGKAAPHGKGKSAGRPVLKASVSGTSPENSLAFPLMLAGGAGLLLSALISLRLSAALGRAASQPRAAFPAETSSKAPNARISQRLKAAEQAVREKQQSDFEAQQADLEAQLAEARQRKAETEALRNQVSRQFQEFFRTLPVACFCFAANGRIIRWNAACELLYGIPAAEALEKTLWETLVPVSEREEAEAKISRVLAGETMAAAERWDTLAGGIVTRLRCSMVPLYDAEGLIIGGLSAGVEITEYARQAEQIEALTAELAAAAEQIELLSSASATDLTSTSIPDLKGDGISEIEGHPAFRARLAEEIERAARYHTPLSLVLLDLDGFTERNRTLGFAAGDEALQSAITAVKSKIRLVDVVARLGADEYAVILPETGDAGARVAVERLRTGVSGTAGGGQTAQTACFGAVLLSPDVSGTDELVCRALAALAAARSRGANTVVHYQDLAPSASRKKAAGDKPPRGATGPDALSRHGGLEETAPALAGILPPPAKQ